jgi:alanyl-tRNA synthetase
MKDYADPRMHTAEHLLNAGMVRMFGGRRAFSSHIEKKKSKCDYRFGRDLTEAERTELERLVNEAIKADLPVTEEFLAREEAAAKFDLGRLPEGAGGEKLRIVKVGDRDACPCAGAHVARSGEIGGFRIISTGFCDGVLRIRFKLAD